MASSRPRAADGPAAGPLAQWLAPALLEWLRARGCRGVVGLDPRDVDGDATPHWEGGAQPGWHVPLGGGRVLLAFDAPGALAADELVEVAALLRRLPALPLVPDARDTVTVDHALARRHIHDLRNGLNTLMLNASLLARVAVDRPALQRSAQFCESAGLACAEHLSALSDLLSRPQGRAGSDGPRDPLAP